MRRYITAVSLWAALALAQPIADADKLAILTAKSAMLEADNDKRAAMMLFNAAENRYEVAKREYESAVAREDSKCAPKRLDAKALECR